MRPRLKVIPNLALIALGLLIAMVFLWQEWRLTGAMTGVPLDDSWIHYRFADNLRNGQGFSFNPGEQISGSTAPLWVILLSLVDSGYLVPSKIIGIAAYLGSGLLVYQCGLTLGLNPSIAFLAGLSGLASGRFAWSAPSGMETTTFAFISLLAIWLCIKYPERGIPKLASLTFGVACLLRPEGYLLLGLSGVIWLFLPAPGWREPGRVMDVVQHYLIAGLVLVPYTIFSWLTTSYLLPNTFYAKHGLDCQLDWSYPIFTGVSFLLDNPVMFVLTGLGLLGFGRDFYRKIILKSQPEVDLPSLGMTLSAFWMVGLPAMYAFVSPCLSIHTLRYSTPLVPVMMLLGALGGQKIYEAITAKNKLLSSENISPVSGYKRINFVQILLLEGILISLVLLFAFWAPWFAQSTADIQTLHVKIGRWMRENTKPSDVIALNDVGAIGVFSDRKVIDLMGLVNAEVIPLIQGQKPGSWDSKLASYLTLKRPDYLVVFPDWFPRMIQELPVEEVYRASLESRRIAGIPNLTITGGGELVVYVFTWSQTR